MFVVQFCPFSWTKHKILSAVSRKNGAKEPLIQLDFLYFIAIAGLLALYPDPNKATLKM
jgi:hypothetical protein